MRRTPTLFAGFATCLLAGALSVLPAVAQEEGEPPTTAGFDDSFLPGFLTAGGALDAPAPDVVITGRLGINVSPAYFGSDDYELGPNGSIRFDYIRFPNGFEFGSGQAVGFRTGWGLRGSVRYIGDRVSKDYDELDGMENVHWAMEAGLGIGYEERNYRFFADMRYGFFGHDSFVGDLGADAIAYPIDGLTLTLGPRISLGSDRFANTYFGVSSSEAVTSDFNAYDASGGVLGAGMTLGARYLLNERWGIEGAATYDRLMNDAADSPITKAGSADQYSFTIGLTRRIGLDF